MNYGGTILLVTILIVMIALLVLAIRGIGSGRRVRLQLEKDEEERLFLKSIGDGQRSIASSLISIQADLADIKNRIVLIESNIKGRE